MNAIRALARAVADYLKRERSHVRAAIAEYEAMSPFRRTCEDSSE